MLILRSHFGGGRTKINRACSGINFLLKLCLLLGNFPTLPSSWFGPCPGTLARAWKGLPSPFPINNQGGNNKFFLSRAFPSPTFQGLEMKEKKKLQERERRAEFAYPAWENRFFFFSFVLPSKLDCQVGLWQFLSALLGWANPGGNGNSGRKWGDLEVQEEREAQPRVGYKAGVN